MSDGAFVEALRDVAEAVEARLADLLAADPAPHEIARPERLIAAMRYATLGGGKRLRPFLLVQSAALFDVPRGQALRTAAALECVHCYSLAHDDLPAMDDDDLRRGKPTLHIAFDEATAVLAGDALLTYAFEILSDPATHDRAAVRADLVLGLARAAGLAGMAGGQMLDLQAETMKHHALADVERLQAMKTGALLAYAAEAGAVLGDAVGAERLALLAYGRAIGAAFQIADDLLDLEGSVEETGKATGKDAAAGKATLVGVLGPQVARERLARLVAEAEHALSPFGERGGMLKATARFIAERRT
jgi:farnesyl diphosphate synthase